MDSTSPELLPVVIPPISHPPFHCQGKGLMHQNHSRESASTLKSWITNKRVRTPLKKPKDWWRAQLLLYGLDAGKSSTKAAELTLSLKSALEKGLEAPTTKIVELENELNAKFRLLNLEARNSKYSALETDDGRAEFDPVKFLRQRFPTKGKRKKDALVVLKIANRAPLHAAAESLGLCSTSADAPGAENARWIIIGCNRDDVLRRASEIGTQRKRWKDEQLKAKRKEVEAQARQLAEAQIGPGKGSLEDVVGEWHVESPGISQQWPQVGTSFRMSFYFHAPVQDESDEDSHEDERLYEAGESDHGEEIRSAKLDGTELLWSNFDLGLFHGVLHAQAQLPHSDLLPSKPIPFSWRGRDFSEEQIQVDLNGRVNTGTLTFQSSTKLTGVLKGPMGEFKFEGSKVSTTPTHKCPEGWKELTQKQWNSECVSRWH